jgi:hypothetical protein
MKNTGGIMLKAFRFAVIATFMIFFGTTASAGSPTNYVIFTNPTSLSFSVPVGGAAVTQSVFVNDTTTGPLPFTLSVDQSWVTISTTSSTTAGGGITLQFGVNPAGLQAGSYTGHVILTASGVSNSPMAFPVTLTVTSSTAGAPAIMTQPASQTVVSGKSATFKVSASGASPMNYQWKKNGLAINGATSSSYITPPTTLSDNSARFTAEVTNTMGAAQSQDAVLTVSQATNYVIFANPTSLSFSLKAGAAPATQSVKVNDTTPGPLPFKLSVDQSWVTISTTVSTTAGGGVVLQFGVNPAGLQAGSYTGHVILTASGVANSPMAFPVSLVITSISSNSAVAPTISSQPASAKVIAGQTASFNVAATGTAPMTYQWSKNGAAISGATSSTYTTPAETIADNNAQFAVGVSNSAGKATSSAAILSVTSASVAPAITTQPASQTVIAGKTASFAVTATGTAPMSYQWSKNGVAISGATSTTYTTPAETSADNNSKFTVAVSNAAGSATSNAAILTVSASSLLLNSNTSSLNFGSVNVSSNSTQTVTLTNAGNSSVTISNVTVSGSGFNASGVSSGLILAPGQTAALTATFAPAAAGSVTGSVSVASNATNSPDSISLSGTGVATVAHSVALTWTPSTSTVIGYNAYSSTVSGGPYTKLTSGPVAATSYTDTAVQAGQTYYFVVTSVDSSNVESALSTEVSALVP